ncbi:MAG: putative transposase, partial [Gemmatimonadetes bacterium]|nr:putative transposase [Gemmatimonadota bacterium]
MAKRRTRLSRAECGESWSRWMAGQTLEIISAALAVSPSGVHGLLRRAGGIRPATPTRSARTLSLVERQVIERGLNAGQSFTAIALLLSRPVSTISREVRRNGGRTAHHRGYHAATADERAWHAARRPKLCRLATNPVLCDIVAHKLTLNWSPATLAGWLRRTYPDDPQMHLSAETIYRSLYVQTRGVLRQELTAHLRRGHSMRRSRATSAARQTSRVRDPISISERPAEAADRAVPGHWEGDLLAGANSSYIATLVERASRYVMLVKVKNKESLTVTRALARTIRRLPTHLKRSLTWDRGTELARHKDFTVATQVQVYFCDPHSPWQRGSNENTNGLLRQYYPKGMDLSAVTQRQLDVIAERLNTRPRQTLDWDTPA